MNKPHKIFQFENHYSINDFSSLTVFSFSYTFRRSAFPSSFCRRFFRRISFTYILLLWNECVDKINRKKKIDERRDARKKKINRIVVCRSSEKRQAKEYKEEEEAEKRIRHRKWNEDETKMKNRNRLNLMYDWGWWLWLKYAYKWSWTHSRFPFFPFLFYFSSFGMCEWVSFSFFQSSCVTDTVDVTAATIMCSNVNLNFNDLFFFFFRERFWSTPKIMHTALTCRQNIVDNVIFEFSFFYFRRRDASQHLPMSFDFFCFDSNEDATIFHIFINNTFTDMYQWSSQVQNIVL